MTSRLPRTFTRFAMVGVVNTVIDVGLFWVLHPSLGIVVANLLSTSAGMTFSFVVNGRHTFGASHLTRGQAAGFLASNAFTMWVLQPVLMLTAGYVVGLPVMACKLLALAGSMVGNFLLYRYAVWPDAARGTTPDDQFEEAPEVRSTYPESVP
jgi:putative flippase GtrA